MHIKQIKLQSSSIKISKHKKREKIAEAKLIDPKGKFYRLWSAIMFFVLFYTATVMPVKVCFIDSSSLGWVVTDTLIDLFFLLDIVVNCNLPFSNSDGVFVT